MTPDPFVLKLNCIPNTVIALTFVLLCKIKEKKYSWYFKRNKLMTRDCEVPPCIFSFTVWWSSILEYDLSLQILFGVFLFVLFTVHYSPKPVNFELWSCCKINTQGVLCMWLIQVCTHFQIPVGNISAQEFPFKIWIVSIINLIFLQQGAGVHKKTFFYSILPY